MINSKEYQILQHLLSTYKIDEKENLAELNSLYKEKLIDYNIVYQDDNSCLYDGYIVTVKGNRAIEEYASFLQKEQREMENLQLSKKANIKSNLSLIFAAVSIVVAILAIIFD